MSYEFNCKVLFGGYSIATVKMREFANFTTLHNVRIVKVKDYD